jgi:GT2 family glycosyltransferase
MKISTIIINYNSGEYIFECINSLLNQSVATEIIVIDNNSNDGSSKKLKIMSEKGGIIYKFLPENIGSSAANNLGMKIIDADAYLILNADIILTENYLEECINELIENENTGAVVGKLLNYYNKDMIDGCGVDLCYECIPIERGKNTVNTASSFNKRTKVFAVCCAAAVYRKSALEAVKNENGNYFDQKYFAFYEDLDLSFRLNIHNYNNIYIPGAIAYHVRGGSTKNQSDFVKYLCLLNSDLFYFKYLNPYFKYRFYRLFHLMHRIIIYKWTLLLKVHKKLDELKDVHIAYDKSIKLKLDSYINKSYYIKKIINIYK